MPINNIITKFGVFIGFLAALMGIYCFCIDRWPDDPADDIDIALNEAKYYFDTKNYIAAIGSCKNASNLYAEIIRQDPEQELKLLDKYYKINTISGDAYFALSQDEDRERNLKDALNAYNICVSIVANDSESYAETQKKLGDTYLELAKISQRMENLNSSIRAYSDVLNVRVFDEQSEKLAQIQNGLGAAHCLLSGVENKSENLNTSISAHKIALEVYGKNNCTLEYAETMNYLGVAYAYLSEVRDTRENLNVSRGYLEAALKIRQDDNNYEDDAQSQNNLGNVYRSLYKLRGDEYFLNLAIKYYNMALKNSTDRLEKAKINNSLGMAYCDLSETQNSLDNLNKSKDFYMSSLAVRTKNDYPIYYADTADGLSITYMKLSESAKTKDEKLKYLDTAFNYIHESERIRRNESKLDHSTTLHNLGFAYIIRYRITSNEKYLDNSINNFSQSLTTRTEDEYPLDYAITMYCMADAYCMLSDYREENYNLEMAKEAYNRSLCVYKKLNNTLMYNRVYADMVLIDPTPECGNFTEIL